MSKPDLQKHTLYLRSGDYDLIADHHQGSAVSAAQVIRGLVATYCDKVVKAPVQTLNVKGVHL
jgi:hypothetical protein